MVSYPAAFLTFVTSRVSWQVLVEEAVAGVEVEAVAGVEVEGIGNCSTAYP
jgi:hypothetical protein